MNRPAKVICGGSILAGIGSWATAANEPSLITVIAAVTTTCLVGAIIFAHLTIAVLEKRIENIRDARRRECR